MGIVKARIGAYSDAPEGVVLKLRKVIAVVAGIIIYVHAGIEACRLYRLAELHGTGRECFVIQPVRARGVSGYAFPIEKHRQIELAVAEQVEHEFRFGFGLVLAYRLREEICAHTKSGRLCAFNVLDEIIVGIQLAASVVHAAYANDGKAHAAVVNLLPVDIALIRRNVNAAAGLVFAPGVGQVSACVVNKLSLVKIVERNAVLRSYPHIVVAVEHLDHAIVRVCLTRGLTAQLHCGITRQKQCRYEDHYKNRPYPTAFFCFSLCIFHAAILSRH